MKSVVRGGHLCLSFEVLLRRRLQSGQQHFPKNAKWHALATHESNRMFLFPILQISVITASLCSATFAKELFCFSNTAIQYKRMPSSQRDLQHVLELPTPVSNGSVS